MRTTIDSAGRIVVPKAIRDALGLDAGRAIDMIFTDGRIEIELAPAEVSIEVVDGLPRAVSTAGLPVMAEDVIRDTLEATRR